MSAATQPAANAAAPSEAVHEALRMVNGFATDGFTAVRTMAELALIAFEQAESFKPRDLERISLILEEIAQRAASTLNDINCEAEAMGCTYVDPAGARRQAAIYRGFSAVREGVAL